MIIKNKVDGFDLSIGTFKFASLYKGELRLFDAAVCGSPGSDVISLIDGSYRIDKGVLYIRATRTFWKSLRATCYEYEFSNWKGRRIYFLSEYFLEDLENPPIETEVIIHRWWRGDKKLKAFETDANTLNWYKMKKEHPFEVAISDFKLFERDTNTNKYVYEIRI